MSNFCAECGQAVEPEWRVCPACGTPIQGDVAQPAEPTTPPAVQPTPVKAPAPPQGAPLSDRLQHLWNQASGPTKCPGCQRSMGTPGALCPYCGSRFPSPRVGLIGIGVAAIGGVLLLVAFISTGGLLETHRRDGSSTIEGLGWLALIAGVVMFVYSVGRSGPQRQASCCGCSCVVAAVLLPGVVLAFWSAGGPAMAGLGVVAWAPLIWTLDAGLIGGWLAWGVTRELAHSVSNVSERAES
jgi:RNA polymerase subunit RPABC4/transcription elongation factor Spt4